jgi:ferredoxin
MAYKIDADACVGCGSCAAECPVECIKEKDGKFVINPDECLECGACAGACPVGAPALDA